MNNTVKKNDLKIRGKIKRVKDIGKKAGKTDRKKNLKGNFKVDITEKDHYIDRGHSPSRLSIGCGTFVTYIYLIRRFVV